jgi:hypothetical protein
MKPDLVYLIESVCRDDPTFPSAVSVLAGNVFQLATAINNLAIALNDLPSDAGSHERYGEDDPEGSA